MKIYSTYIITSIIQIEEEKEKRTERIFKEIMAKNLPNLEREMDIQISSSPKVPNRSNLKRSILRH